LRSFSTGKCTGFAPQFCVMSADRLKADEAPIAMMTIFGTFSVFRRRRAERLVLPIPDIRDPPTGPIASRKWSISAAAFSIFGPTDILLVAIVVTGE